MAASTEGTQASSRPMSRVARKLADSSQEIPATAGLSLPALRGDAVVPPRRPCPSSPGTRTTPTNAAPSRGRNIDEDDEGHTYAELVQRAPRH